MSHEDVQRWLDAYVEAWRTYDPEAVGALFTDDVAYAYTPVDSPCAAETRSWPTG